MDFQQTRDYLLSRPEASEDFPFGPDVAVMKIKGKMFATLSVDTKLGDGGVAVTNLKCDPEEALMLRDIFEAITPGYHMNKRHWNTVALDGTVPRGEIERMIDRSYGLVVRGLRKVEREALVLAYGEDEIFR